MTATTPICARLKRSATTLLALLALLLPDLLAFPRARAESLPFPGLLLKSPFGQPAPTSATEPPNPPNRLELRGVVVEGDECFFNIFDSAAGKSAWIPLNQKTDGLLVAAYDASKDRITVVQQGQRLELDLKRAVVGGQPSVTPANQSTAASTSVQNDDPKPGPKRRLALIRAELRRHAEDISAGQPP